MLRRGQTPAALLFLAPFLITTAAFFFYAFGRAIYYSFTDFNLFNEPRLIGVKPYADVLGDPSFRRALANSLVFAVITTTLQTVGALLMAVALNTRIRGMGFFRSAWYMPSITSSVVITLIFLWLFQRRGELPDHAVAGVPAADPDLPGRAGRRAGRAGAVGTFAATAGRLAGPGAGRHECAAGGGRDGRARLDGRDRGA
ncbi:carbohydrate ABC transporter permease [Deinococcus sp. ME38]|uniref:carbohydrate ABC transporter permease n=1 Tax=Deinococcus sp. ME38 TaxID=3400344 RepID=UPI003B5C8056